MAGGLECHARSHGSAGTRLPPPPFQFPEQATSHSLPSITHFFYIHETHCRVYTNKPRALLMQQALYNEPKRARLLWEVGMSVQTLGGFPLQQKPSSPFFTTPLNLHLPKSSFPAFTQAVHTGTPDQCGPATLVDSHNVSSALLVDKGIDYQILQRI